MKALCIKDGSFRGIIENMRAYEELKSGEKEWKPHVKEHMKTVIIPYELFEYFMALDKEVDENDKILMESGVTTDERSEGV